MQNKIIYIFILLIFSTNLTVGQIDTLNGYNSKRQKNGYWKVFLDGNSNVVRDSTKAYFYGFELWDNGKKAYFFAKHSKVSSYSGPTLIKGHPIPISGTFKWFDHKGRPSLEEKYDNGHPIVFKSYHGQRNKTDTTLYLFEEINYMKRYNNIPGTALYQEHSFDNLVKSYWFRQGEKGWRAYYID